MARRILILGLLACLLLAVRGGDTHSEVFRFEEILQESIGHSCDLKISGLEVFWLWPFDIAGDLFRCK